MKRNGAPPELVLDLLVPARLASRYRVRLTALSRVEGQLQLAFCPSIFCSGVLSECPAEVSLVFKGISLRLRGLLRVQSGSHGTTGRIRFDEPLGLREFDDLRRACRLENAVLVEDAARSSTQSSEPLSPSLDESAPGPTPGPDAASLH